MAAPRLWQAIKPWPYPVLYELGLPTLQSQIRHRGQKKTQKSQRIQGPSVPKFKEKWVSKLAIISEQQKKALEKKPQQKIVFDESVVPTDDVWLTQFFAPQKYSLQEALNKHREFAHPDMLDNMDAFVNITFELNMGKKKKKKHNIPTIHGVVSLPYMFEDGLQSRVLVFTKSPEVQAQALAMGAVIAGGPEIVKEVQEGMLDKSDFDYTVCTPEMLMQLVPIRSLLQYDFPNKLTGNLGNNIEEMVKYFSKGRSYSSKKLSAENDSSQVLDICIGKLTMSDDELAENYDEYMQSIFKRRPKNHEGTFIEAASVTCPPSIEEFRLLDSLLIPAGYEIDDDDEGDEPLESQQTLS